MAPALLRGPHVLSLFLLRFWLFVSARALDMSDQDAPELTCGEGLTDCNMSSDFPFSAALPDPNDAVDVMHMQLKVMLCCSATKDCEPCLQIIITVQEVDETEEVSEGSGEADGSGQIVFVEQSALVKVGLSFPGSIEVWRTLQFKLDHSGLFQASQQPTHKEMMKSRDDQQKHTDGAEASLNLHESAESPEPEDITEVLDERQVMSFSSGFTADSWRSRKASAPSACLCGLSLDFILSSLRRCASNITELLLTEKVMFGSPVVVQADSKATHIVQNITIPSLEEVCSMNQEKCVMECDAPRLRAQTDYKRNVVLLQLENTSCPTDARQEDLMIFNEMSGEMLAWPQNKTEMVISSNFVAPCLCFQVWWKGKEFRREFCPFKNKQDALERMQHNVSLSLTKFQIREGGTGLSWNVSAPCRLEAEVWLCKKDLAGGQCEEVTGSRQSLLNHVRTGWISTRKGHWKTGEFNVSLHPLLCVQIKIHGMESYLEPHCPFTTSRWRWSLPLLIGLLLMCLTILGAYFIQGVLKGYVWRWLKEDDVKGAVGGGHVVLLYPPDEDQALPGLMCHLGSSLQALGFSVSLDLWSQAELSVLGPVPWLHSRLDRLKRQGGKVVLVLTQATWIKAEEWGARSWERNTPRERNRDREEEEAGRSYPASSPCVDVFSASLSCILADYLQGRAGERFMLVQFESLPPEPPGGFRPLPELFRGLHVYSLPSQSLGFLTELAGARQMANASARRKRAGGLRVASRVLARGLSGFTAGTTVLRLAGVSQSCVGAGAEDSGEMVPLQPCLITPPSSPDTNPKVSEMEWV